MASPYKSIRVFQNPWLERLTHVHPITPLVLWGPLVALGLYRSLTVHGLSGWQVTETWLAALLIWTLTEYGLHRYVFHFEAKTPFQKRIAFLIHGLHHDDPNDPTRLVMPPAAALILAAFFFPAFVFLLGPAWGETFFAGFVVGYLIYDYIHYSVHHFRPRTRAGKALKKYHMEHHFVTHNAKWGVSSPLWDYVFGTTGAGERASHADSSFNSPISRNRSSR